MNKRELIDTINALNPSATREFLEEFSIRDLTDYVKQLESAREPTCDASTSPSHASVE